MLQSRLKAGVWINPHPQKRSTRVTIGKHNYYKVTHILEVTEYIWANSSNDAIEQYSKPHVIQSELGGVLMVENILLKGSQSRLAAAEEISSHLKSLYS